MKETSSSFQMKNHICHYGILSALQKKKISDSDNVRVDLTVIINGC